VGCSDAIWNGKEECGLHFNRYPIDKSLNKCVLLLVGWSLLIMHACKLVMSSKCDNCGIVLAELRTN